MSSDEESDPSTPRRRPQPQHASGSASGRPRRGAATSGPRQNGGPSTSRGAARTPRTPQIDRRSSSPEAPRAQTPQFSSRRKRARLSSGQAKPKKQKRRRETPERVNNPDICSDISSEEGLPDPSQLNLGRLTRGPNGLLPVQYPKVKRTVVPSPTKTKRLEEEKKRAAERLARPREVINLLSDDDEDPRPPARKRRKIVHRAESIIDLVSDDERPRPPSSSTDVEEVDAPVLDPVEYSGGFENNERPPTPPPFSDVDIDVEEVVDAGGVNDERPPTPPPSTDVEMHAPPSTEIEDVVTAPEGMRPASASTGGQPCPSVNVGAENFDARSTVKAGVDAPATDEHQSAVSMEENKSRRLEEAKWSKWFDEQLAPAQAEQLALAQTEQNRSPSPLAIASSPSPRQIPWPSPHAPPLSPLITKPPRRTPTVPGPPPAPPRSPTPAPQDKSTPAPQPTAGPSSSVPRPRPILRLRGPAAPPPPTPATNATTSRYFATPAAPMRASTPAPPRTNNSPNRRSSVFPRADVSGDAYVHRPWNGRPPTSEDTYTRMVNTYLRVHGRSTQDVEGSASGESGGHSRSPSAAGEKEKWAGGSHGRAPPADSQLLPSFSRLDSEAAPPTRSPTPAAQPPKTERGEFNYTPPVSSPTSDSTLGATPPLLSRPSASGVIYTFVQGEGLVAKQVEVIQSDGDEDDELEYEY
ncbi:hypothetical protein C8J57DRAFT_1360415 [Mycena rebaudengoi]|nr:hypothetical protein C8J57DRAFT_1360415 [Mycena rebaudengoi]